MESMEWVLILGGASRKQFLKYLLVSSSLIRLSARGKAIVIPIF